MKLVEDVTLWNNNETYLYWKPIDVAINILFTEQLSTVGDADKKQK